MIMNAYAVFDVKAGVYGSPFFTHNDQMALRMFQQACEDPNTSMYRFPADFTLFRLAAFDDGVGSFENQKAEPIAGAIQFALKDATDLPFFEKEEAVNGEAKR